MAEFTKLRQFLFFIFHPAEVNAIWGGGGRILELLKLHDGVNTVYQ